MSKSDSLNIDGTTIVELNVGGVIYATSTSTLTSEPDSLLARMFLPSGSKNPGKDAKSRYFIDRDGVLFRYVLDYLRTLTLTLPEAFQEIRRLRHEAEYYQLSGLVKLLGGGGGGRAVGNINTSCGGEGMTSDDPSTLGGGMQGLGMDGGRESGYVVCGYRGTFAFGRDGMADVKFRKLSRILVSGRVSICREVFQDSLNESRDPDRGTSDRYSARFFLKHTFIEQAFDALQEAGFRMVGSAGSGTNSAGEAKPGMDSEENKWNHYNEFVFCRP